MKIRLPALLLALSAFSITFSAQAAIIYTVSTDGGTPITTISPIAAAQSAADYYDYGFEASSGNPGFGTVDDEGFFWLYEDSGTGVLSLGMIFDKRIAGGAGSGGSIQLTSAGFPGVTVSVADEESPSGTFINGTDSWNWNSSNTDGGMISGLEGQTWSIDITVDAFTGLNGFGFVDGPSAAGSSTIALALAAGDTLTITATEVPAPVALFVMLAGLAGLGFSRRSA